MKTEPYQPHSPIDPARTALLVIDMQNAFTEEDSPFCVAMAASTIPAIARTVDCARENGIQVIWIVRYHKEDGGDMEAFRSRRLKELGQSSLMSPGEHGAELADGLEIDKDDIVIAKTRYSAFYQTGLDNLLEEKKIDTILLAGTQTPNCIRAAAFDAFQRDMRTILLEDCTSSATEQIQQSNLHDLRAAGIETVQNLERLDLSV